MTDYEATVVPRADGLTEGIPKVYGTGEARVLTGPRVRQATWSRQGLTKATNFVDRDLSPVRFLPGRTWVLLLPDGTRVAP
jgi:hypothetical protein